MNIEQLKNNFREQFGGDPQLIVRAPGRVNLIGEHTDYNDGFVLPMAIERAVWIALEPQENHKVEIYSINYKEKKSFDLNHFTKDDMSWFEYIKGVAWALESQNFSLKGFRGVIFGDVPLGAGLSSSAAVELAIARSFDTIGNLNLTPADLALIGQKAENKWVGVNCGIMDQMISSAGQKGKAIMLDCRSLKYELVPLLEGTRVVILDTATRRGLESSAYNERRSQCEAGASFFNQTHLRDVSLDELKSAEDKLDPLTYKRCHHVVSENQRVQDAVGYLNQGDVSKFGELMNLSHVSLRDDFEVSCKELNIMQEIALEQQGCFGARMTGAGFGGCAVALVEESVADQFAENVSTKYEEATELKPNIYITSATDGASVV